MLGPAEHSRFVLPCIGRFGTEAGPPRRARGIEGRHHRAGPSDKGRDDQAGKRNQHIGDHRCLQAGFYNAFFNFQLLICNCQLSINKQFQLQIDN